MLSQHMVTNRLTGSHNLSVFIVGEKAIKYTRQCLNQQLMIITKHLHKFFFLQILTTCYANIINYSCIYAGYDGISKKLLTWLLCKEGFF